MAAVELTDGFADRVVVQTDGLTEPSWLANLTLAPLGLFATGDVDIFQTTSFGTVTDEFLLADIIDINGTAPLQGDFDGNGFVDGADLTDPVLGWQARFGVDLTGADFLVWQRNLGLGVPPLAASVVPEPSSLAILLVGLAGTLLSGRRKLQSD